MKTNLMLIAAVLTLTAAAAYGQDRGANIPFAFRTMTGEQAAGHYVVIRNLGALALQDVDSNKAVILGIGSPETDSKNAAPRLVFRCGSESGCVLSSVWNGDGRGISYRAPHLKPSELEHVAVLYLNH